MGCCGDRRATTTARFATATQATPASSRWSALAIPVRYIGGGAVAVVGTVTSRTYTFRSPGSVERVDTRDVAGLLRTGRFRRV